MSARARHSGFLQDPSAHSVVTQAKAGVHDLLATWIPAFAGMTGRTGEVDVRCAVSVNTRSSETNTNTISSATSVCLIQPLASASG